MAGAHCLLSAGLCCALACVGCSAASTQQTSSGFSGNGGAGVADSKMDLPFDQLTWLTTHNAYANTADSHWLAPDQTVSLRGQLDAGVRALELDTHEWNPPSYLCWVSLGNDCYPAGVYLCHDDCGKAPGVTYALPRQPFSGALAVVRDFLHDNPLAVVTLFLEDYSTSDDLRASFAQVPDVLDLIFDPASPDWAVQQRGWPTLRALTNANKRLLIFTDNSNNDGIYGVRWDRLYTVRNYWSIGETGTDYSCTSRWSALPLNQQENGWNRLFEMSHFRDVGVPIASDVDNAYANLQSRVNQYCLPAAGRLPNYIMVDFFDRPNGDAQRFVDDMNAGR